MSVNNQNVFTVGSFTGSKGETVHMVNRPGARKGISAQWARYIVDNFEAFQAVVKTLPSEQPPAAKAADISPDMMQAFAAFMASQQQQQTKTAPLAAKRKPKLG